MTIEQMIAQCAASIESCARLGIEPDQASILVVTPKGWKAPPKFPRGWIAQWKHDGSRLRYLPAARLLAWAKVNKLMSIQRGGQAR